MFAFSIWRFLPYLIMTSIVFLFFFTFGYNFKLQTWQENPIMQHMCKYNNMQIMLYTLLISRKHQWCLSNILARINFLKSWFACTLGDVCGWSFWTTFCTHAFFTWACITCEMLSICFLLLHVPQLQLQKILSWSQIHFQIFICNRRGANLFLVHDNHTKDIYYEWGWSR